MLPLTFVINSYHCLDLAYSCICYWRVLLVLKKNPKPPPTKTKQNKNKPKTKKPQNPQTSDIQNGTIANLQETFWFRLENKHL